MASIYATFGFYPLIARVVMALLSTAIVGMVYVLGRRLFNEPVARLAVAIAAVYAYLIFYGVTLVTETPFTLALMLVLYIAIRIREGNYVALGHGFYWAHCWPLRFSPGLLSSFLCQSSCFGFI
ncbi:MAG: glycosyltransferase family 39 protein [Caldilineaceae bacterium]